MILGLTPLVFVHTLISLAAVAAGILAVVPLLSGRVAARPAAAFLALTLATVLSGFVIPPAVPAPSPPQLVGLVTAVVLVVAGLALYGQRLAGHWAPIYAASAALALYLNVFVLIVQVFLKIPALNALAPTQTEPPFVATQAVALVGWLVVTAIVVARSRRRAPAV
jgi:hypothetical protein